MRYLSVKMKKHQLGQDSKPDGSALPAKRYKEGEEYVVGESLANALKEMGAADIKGSAADPSKSEAKKVEKPGPARRKNQGAAPENK